MQPPPIPENEKERLLAVLELGILDTASEERFDKITREAVKYFNVPMSMISIIDKEREWYKSCVGVRSRESPRAVSFCGHALLAKDVFIVEDTHKDPRFKDNPSVTGPPFVRFYAGIALRNLKNNHLIGVFCIKSREPRTLSSEETEKLFSLALEAEKELNRK